METGHANAQEAAKHRQIEPAHWCRAIENEQLYTGGSGDRLPTHCAWSRAAPNPAELPDEEKRAEYKGSLLAAVNR